MNLQHNSIAPYLEIILKLLFVWGLVKIVE